MSNIKISSNLFLGEPELNRMVKFLDTEGFRKNILDNSSTFGLIRNDIDINFSNAKVSPDADVIIGGNTFKTIQYNQIKGVDKDGLFIFKEAVRQLPIPDDGLWHWLRIKHEYTHNEKGNWTLSADGILTGTGGELTKILRGQPNFPSRVRFTNAQLNYLDYDILEVIDDNNCVLNGVSFQAEANLKLSVVGTFNYGSPLNPNNREIFNYDSCFVELVTEPLETPNSAPSTNFVTNKTFYIARIKVINGQVVVQDKRTEFWETKASYQNKAITKLENPLVGIEAIKYNHEFTSGDKNIVELAWSFRSANWSINSSTNTLTISTGLGGIYKSVNNFQNGDFDGWRLYAPDGTYSIVSSSVLNGNAIDLKLNVLDVDHFSNDGGNTYLTTQGAYVVVTPDAEEIEMIFKPNLSSNIETQTQRFNFPINEKIGRCDVLVYLDPSCTYVVKYRYKNGAEYTGEELIPSDVLNGYYKESSFDQKGNLLVPAQTTRVTYTKNETTGFITLNLSPNAYKHFVFKVDKGDLIGVNKMTNVSSITQIDLIVGQSLNYLLFEGSINLTSNLYIVINSQNQVNGNRFTIHFNCNSINLNGFKIFIASSTSGGIGSPLKTIEQGDVYQMKNIDNGIVFNCICDGNFWYVSQNYELGRPYEYIEVDGVISALFDVLGKGKVKGLFGYAICDLSISAPTIDGISIPDLRDRFLVGQSATKQIGTIGGSDTAQATLVAANLPAHSHNITFKTAGFNDDDGSGQFIVNAASGYNEGDRTIVSSSSGSSTPDPINVSLQPKYYSVIKAKKLF